MAKTIDLSDKLYTKLERLSKEAEMTPQKYIHMLLLNGSKVTDTTLGLFPSYSTSQ